MSCMSSPCAHTHIFSPCATQSQAEERLGSMCVGEPVPRSPMYSQRRSTAALPKTACSASHAGARSKWGGTTKSCCRASEPPRAKSHALMYTRCPLPPAGSGSAGVEAACSTRSRSMTKASLTVVSCSSTSPTLIVHG
eukprot:scaffold1208_cov113-Isochrysis_galbana.AAC.8